MGNWDAYPQSDVVRWSPDEKIIGILGVAPLATADFFRCCCSRPVRKDWEHPRILIDSNPKIPSRGRCLELGETSPVPFLRASIGELAARGAQIIAVPCNTAHIFHAEYAADAPVPVPSIIDVTARAAIKAGTSSVLVLASRHVVQARLYDRAFAGESVSVHYPDAAGQQLVSEAIEAVKQTGGNRKVAGDLQSLVRESGAEAVILACTELPQLFSQEDAATLAIQRIDSNQALADYCLDWALS